MSKYENIQQVAKDVDEIQNASNITAVIRAWGEMQSVIHAHAHEVLHVHPDRHPCNVAMLSKVTSLMRVNADCIGGVTGSPARVWQREQNAPGEREDPVDLTVPALWDAVNSLARGEEI